MLVVICLAGGCAWILCAVAAYSLIKKIGNALSWRDTVLILLLGPIGLVGLLHVLSRNSDD